MNDFSIPELNLNDYIFELPKEKIALHPLSERSESKLLVGNCLDSSIRDCHFNDIAELIEDDALIIINETKVIGARLHFAKPTGGRVELLLVEPVKPSIIPALTLAAKGACSWECIVGGKNIYPRMELTFAGFDITLKAKIISRVKNRAEVEFTWEEDITFSEILIKAGETPLPPYIDRHEDEEDKERYQTVYAENQGSVAAPTAGLHFTDEIMDKLIEKGVEFARITLHIGPGTFQPVEADKIENHEMHHEQVFVSIDTIKSIHAALSNNRRIIAVGTTCMRTVESLFWLASKTQKEEIDFKNFELGQWESYRELRTDVGEEILKDLIDKLEKNGEDELIGKTQLLIIPGYKFRIVNGLITNFHMPNSTLILLVAAFTGEPFRKKIYEHALKNDYRFLSYGDSSYLIKSIS
jgi:S-adenosylmethionine:tRNA ribosyltransferase-isomerase